MESLVGGALLVGGIIIIIIGVLMVATMKPVKPPKGGLSMIPQKQIWQIGSMAGEGCLRGLVTIYTAGAVLAFGVLLVIFGAAILIF